MATLRDKSDGSLIGNISEDDMRFLMEQLEEESEDDGDYYIDEGTVDLLEEEGGSVSLIKLLRDAVTEKADGIDVEWTRD
jgi:hypothetical protein